MAIYAMKMVMFLENMMVIFNYTIGQRKGIRIGGNKNYSEKPWFVIGKDIDENKLIISQDQDRLISSGKGRT